MKKSKGEEEEEPRSVPTIEEGTPTRVMLRYFPNLNPGVSINQGTILIDMDKIGGSFSSKIWMGKFIVFTKTIQPINMMNDQNKNR